MTSYGHSSPSTILRKMASLWCVATPTSLLVIGDSFLIRAKKYFNAVCVTLKVYFPLQKKQTPLHLAAEAGQLEVCDTLLQLGADTNATNDAGQKAVHVAAMRNNSEVVKLFLKTSPELVTTADKVRTS